MLGDKHFAGHDHSIVAHAHFDVERSGDTGTWEKVDVVDAAGNSQMPIRYATTDHAPLPGLSYYRLRTVDLDGSFKFSPVVPVASRVT